MKISPWKDCCPDEAADAAGRRGRLGVCDLLISGRLHWPFNPLLLRISWAELLVRGGSEGGLLPWCVSKVAGLFIKKTI